MSNSKGMGKQRNSFGTRRGHYFPCLLQYATVYFSSYHLCLVCARTWSSGNSQGLISPAAELSSGSTTSGAQQRQPGLCGLVNSGNSCYMNAVLQCLCSTVPLVEHFLSQQTKEDISR